MTRTWVSTMSLIWDVVTRSAVAAQAHSIQLTAAKLERHARVNISEQQARRYVNDMRAMLDAIEGRINGGTR